MFAKMQDPKGKWWGIEMGTDNLGRPRIYSITVANIENYKVPVVSWEQAGCTCDDAEGESPYDRFKAIVEGAALEYASARRGA